MDKSQHIKINLFYIIFNLILYQFLLCYVNINQHFQHNFLLHKYLRLNNNFHLNIVCIYFNYKILYNNNHNKFHGTFIHIIMLISLNNIFLGILNIENYFYIIDNNPSLNQLNSCIFSIQKKLLKFYFHHKIHLRMKFII